MMYREQILNQIDAFEAEKRLIQSRMWRGGTIWQAERLRLLERNIASYKSLLPMARDPKRDNPFGNNPHRPRTKEHMPPVKHEKYFKFYDLE